MVTQSVTMSTAGDVARGFSRGVTRFALPFPTAARRAATSTLGGVVKRKRRRDLADAMPTAKETVRLLGPSVGVTKSELMVFTDVPVQMSVEESFWETVKCQNLSPLDHRAPLEFHVSPHRTVVILLYRASVM